MKQCSWQPLWLTGVLCLLLYFILGVHGDAFATYDALEIHDIPEFGQRLEYTIPAGINPRGISMDVSVNGQYMDCGIDCLAMIEGYYKGYGNEDIDVYHAAMVASNEYKEIDWGGIDISPFGDTTVDPTRATGYVALYSIDIDWIYGKLSAGDPVMVHRGGSSEHWVVIYGYDGVSDSLEWQRFMIMSPHAPYNSADGYHDNGVFRQHLSDLVDNLGSLNRLMYRDGGISSLPLSAERHTFVITYNANGGNGTPDAQITKEGVALRLSSVIPTYDSRNFLGWATSTNAIEAEYFPEQEIIIESDLLLYAVWSQIGTSGDNITWELFNDGTLIISGNGEMQDGYSWPRQKIVSVVIEDGVTCIGKEAFSNHEKLRDVTIPKSVTNIKYYAFKNCTELRSIMIPEGVVTLGGAAFEGCKKLSVVSLPQSLTTISGESFKSCGTETGLSINIPDSVTVIGEYAFNGCTKLKHLIIPSSVASIGKDSFVDCDQLTNAGPVGSGFDYEFGWTSFIPDYAFSYCISLSTISLPDTIKEIGERAFSECTALTSVLLPDSVISIGPWAFYNCTRLRDINMPKSLISIGRQAFHRCSELLSIEMPDSATEIGESAFARCSKLEYIKFSAGLSKIDVMLLYECESIASIVIPLNVTEIGMSAFYGCISMTSISIPSSVTYIDHHAIGGCTILNDVYYDGTKNDWQKVNIQKYNDSLSNATIHFRADPVYSVNYDLNAKGNVSIWYEAPSSQILTSDGVILADLAKRDTSAVITLNEIGYTFLGWSKDENSQMPEYYPGDEYIDTENVIFYAIWERRKMTMNFNVDDNTWTEMTDWGTETQLPNPRKDGYFFIGWRYKSPKYAAYSMIKGTMKIERSYSFTAQWIERTDLIMPNFIENIEEYAFEGINASCVIVPSNIKSIGSYAFANNSNLCVIVFYGDDVVIEDTAFYKCKNLLVVCHTGSAASSFCRDHNLKYIETDSIDDLLRDESFY